MRRNLYHIFLFMLLSIIVACSDSREKALYKIGVSQCSGGDWREKMNDEMLREMLFHEEVEIEILTADDNNEKQIKDIEYFIDKKFDIIIAAPNEDEAITPVLKKAYEAGIPVIVFDRKIKEDYYTVYMDLDNNEIGKTAAEYAALIAGGENIILLEVMGLPGSTPAQERHTGFIENIQKYPNLHLVSSIAADWSEEKAYNSADSLLTLYPEVKVIYAHNDPMAVGVSRRFKELGRQDIKIIGTDASPLSGMPAVKNGLIDATIIYPTEGERIIKAAIDILHGKNVDKVIKVPSLAPVDTSNADILIRQYELIKEETNKIKRLDEMNEALWLKHKAQTVFLWTVIGFSILLIIVVAFLIVFILENRRLGKILSIRDLIASRKLRKVVYENENANNTGNIETVSNKDDEITSRKSDEFYTKFIAIIKQNYSDPTLNTEKIASKLSLGPAQLARKIKSATGFSPVEILRTYRLEEAKKLLEETDKTVSEITNNVGFSSAAYLAKCFREAYGVTPTEVRER